MSGSHRREAYARDFEAGIRRAQLSEIDTNFFLSSLTGELPPQEPNQQRSDLQRLATLPSLEQISAKIVELGELAEDLQQRYRLRRPRGTGADYIHIEDPENPAPVDRVLDSWLLLRGMVEISRSVVAERSQALAEQRNVPRRWRRPIRIASTGNPDYDAQVAHVMEDLRRDIPELPIDDQSFPNPVEQANAFLDWGGVRCPERAACQSMDTWPAFRAAYRRYQDTSSPQVDSLHVLAFFDQLRAGRWFPRSEIVPLNAYIGLQVAAAWLRTGEDGAINTAVCTYVAGPGTDGWGRHDPAVPGGRVRASAEEIRRAIRGCLGAAMGAPTTSPQWSIRMVPLRRDLCCAQPAGQPETYSQDEMLRQLYR